MSDLLRLHEISERQHGLALVDQALAAGLCPGELAHAEEQVWHQPHEVVRRVGDAR